MNPIFGLLFLFFYASVVVANEPASQPTNANFSLVRAYNFNFSFTPSQADGFLVLKSRQPISFVPTDGDAYQLGEGVGNAKVLSASSSSSFLVREVVENTTYYFAVFAYNGSGNSIDYKTDNPLTANITSAAANVGNYYAGLDANSANFLTQLTQKIKNRNNLDYNDYDNFLVSTIYERDTIGGQKVVTCQYSGEQKIYSGTFSFQNAGYSREHLLPRSWMPTGGATSTPEGSDYHNLALTNLNNANSLRSNYPYGEVVNATTTFLQCKLGDNAQSDIVFEPREDMKGNAARGVFYQMLCYNGTGGNWGYFNLESFGNTQDFDVLLDWHFNDLPDAFEKARHEYIAAIQNNRNPFIDFPELANCIDFSQITKQGNCVNVPVVEKDILQNVLHIIPNPATDVVQFSSTINTYEMKLVKLYDIAGKCVVEENINSTSYSININTLPKGFYQVFIYLQDGKWVNEKLVVQ